MSLFKSQPATGACPKHFDQRQIQNNGSEGGIVDALSQITG